jgi:RNA polymerase sigma factor (sigma-70 family)
MSPSEELETTLDLVSKIQGGDDGARNRLLKRYLPALTRWAHGRLPIQARDLNETADLVQVTLVRAFQSLPAFTVHGEGAFFGYLRHVMANLIKDELRRAGRRPGHDEVDPDLPDGQAQPDAQAISGQTLAAYEQALRQLDAEDRELVIMKVELGLSNEEIAIASRAPSTNAGRMRLARAMVRLAEFMNERQS